MAIFTSAQLRSLGGSVSKKARFKKKLGGSESTYSIILNALDEFHYKAKNTNEYKSIRTKIDQSSAILDLANQWCENHKKTNQSETKRRNALSLLINQILEMDWEAWALKNIDYHLARENFSNVIESGVVLRGNGMLEKRITEFSRLTGSIYAKEILQPVILRASKTPNIAKQSLVDNVVNKKKIKSIYDLLVGRILEADVPIPFAKGTRIVTNKILSKTKIPAAGYNTLVNFVFLRLLNPFLVQPVTFSVVNELPNGKFTNRTLVTIGALLQNQANRKYNDQDDRIVDLLTPYKKKIPKYLVNNVYKVAGGGSSVSMNKFYL